MANRHVGMALLYLVASSAVAAETTMLVRLRPDVPRREAKALLDTPNTKLGELIVPALNLYLVKVKKGRSLDSALDDIGGHDEVLYAQKDHRVKLRYAPNDAKFSEQWALHNTRGTAEIHAREAWEIAHGGGHDRDGNDVVLAVIDDGFELEHPDLADNIYTNPGEIPNNGIDDDGNGYIDDVHGWNAATNDGQIGLARHGTHVMGIAGARGDNGLFVAGINWNAKLLPIVGSSDRTSVVAKAYGYVIAQKKLWLESGGKKGANIIVTNSSFGVDDADCEADSFPVWNDLYNEMGKLGILSAVATTNEDTDVDAHGDVPSGCSSKYLVTVTNTNSNDEKNHFAGYGPKHVMLGAPGTDILSTLPNDQVGLMSGTSMATPHVAGALALMYSVASPALMARFASAPEEAALELKRMLLDTVDVVPALQGIVGTGGRLNLARAVEAATKY